MKRFVSVFFLVAALGSLSLSAQDIAGDWQGTLNAGSGFRLILKIAKSDAGGWKATVYSIDQSPNGLPVSSIALHMFSAK
jgi:hypothetical protein